MSYQEKIVNAKYPLEYDKWFTFSSSVFYICFDGNRSRDVGCCQIDRDATFQHSGEWWSINIPTGDLFQYKEKVNLHQSKIELTIEMYKFNKSFLWDYNNCLKHSRKSNNTEVSQLN